MVKTAAKIKKTNRPDDIKQPLPTDLSEPAKARHLYLMRHGKSEKPKKKNKDVLRPLEKRGRKDVKKIRKLMRKQHIRPDLILCSPSLRTVETLKKLKKAFPPTEVVFIDALYMADADEIMHILHQIAPEKHDVLLIGHNPGLQDFLTQIEKSGNERPKNGSHRVSEGFPTAALACLELTRTWPFLSDQSARLMNFVYSSDL